MFCDTEFIKKFTAASIKNKIKEEIEVKEKFMSLKGFVFEYNNTFYTQADIDAGKCPLNGTLINLGLKHYASCTRGNKSINCIKCKKESKKKKKEIQRARLRKKQKELEQERSKTSKLLKDLDNE